MKKILNPVCRFSVQPGWRVLITDMGMNPAEVLQRAELPVDLFARKEASLSTSEYFRLWCALEETSDDPIFPIHLVEALSAEVFDPPIFAAYCSPNLNIALKRLSAFKRIIGPMQLDIKETKNFTQLTINFLEKDLDIPVALIASELGFFVQLARIATREYIKPLAITTPIIFSQKHEYTKFFGVSLKNSKQISVVFSAKDATRPFITENESMWNFFEPSLRKRLSDLDVHESYLSKVRGVLLELLPSGQTSIEDVASKLAVSKRTLQRRLGDEDISYQTVLSDIRKELAIHYVTNSELPYNQISLLLGYDDPNSFFRAFHSWTGSTPESIRSNSSH